MKTSIYYIFIVILIVFSITNCDLPNDVEDSQPAIIGTWKTVIFGTDILFTLNEDMTFYIESRKDDSLTRGADGTWSYNTDTSEFTMHIDNLLIGDVYGPPPEGQTQEATYYTTAGNDRLLLACFLGGDSQAGTGNWNTVIISTTADGIETTKTINLHLTARGDLSYSYIEVEDGETATDESCNANYTFNENQMIITNSTDTKVLNNGTYVYEIVNMGFYFSKLGELGFFPFDRVK